MAGKPFAYYELISIHAPREGSDLLREGRTNKERNFNPRSPRGERPRWSRKTAGSSHFNPRSPRGERQFSAKLVINSVDFNPRSPRGERPTHITLIHPRCLFQSTLPARGATSSTAHRSTRPGDFNPRSPRGERLFGECVYCEMAFYFNPRSPRGERRKGQRKPAPQKQFQSTLPARGATCKGKEDTAAYKFQSTLPARGAT